MNASLRDQQERRRQASRHVNNEHCKRFGEAIGKLAFDQVVPMKKQPPPLAPVLRQIVRALRANDDSPESHARALEAYLRLAQRATPARGIFESGSRDEDWFYQRIHAIADKHLGRASARSRFTKAVEASGLPFKKQDSILTSAGDFQEASDTAYFYAGLAFALSFVWYGAVFAMASPTTATRDQVR